MIRFWHDIFRHINADWFKTHGRTYPWENSDRKILANTARKYGSPSVMAMWDLYFKTDGYWRRATGGKIYGMVRDSARIFDCAEFKPLARQHEDRLDRLHGLKTAGDLLKSVGL